MNTYLISHKLFYLRVPSIVGIIILLALAGSVFLYAKNMMEKITSIYQYPELLAVESETADWKVYRNEEYGYEFEYFKDWKIFEGEGFVALTNPNHVDVQIEIQSSFFTPSPEDLPDKWADEWLEATSEYGDIVEAKKVKATVHELQAVFYKNPRGQAYERWVTGFRHPGRNEFFKVIYNNADEGKSEEIYQHILSTFRFLNDNVF